ncbi:hypothetical protein [Methylocystis sp. ATCC 49242]|uniref:hypothetical protein n=1 Tax=Methylocystis sp. ATCC 49242 TaxID=622637 RepID=UPI0002EADD3F|nr:hypothetical protein [Methylocystis sp. ATCC 49242]
MAGEISDRSAGIRLSPTTSLFVGMALEGYAESLDQREAGELPFIVTAIDPDGGSEVIAAAKNLHVATAAFTASVVARPKSRIVLRHGARVISENRAQEATSVTKAME